MRLISRFGLTLGFTLAVATILAGADQEVQAQDWAVNMFETLEHDFGVVARGAKAEYRFVFKNIYVEDVHVASARSSCGCTLVRVENPLVKTYETGAIVATVNSRAFTGARSATITVVFDKPQYAEVQLRVRSYIRSDVVFQPEAVSFGTVDEGTGAQKTVTVSYAGRSSWRIEEIISPLPYISTGLSEPTVVGNQVVYQVRVTLDPSAPPGNLSAHLILRTNDRSADAIPLTVEGIVVPPISVTPETLFLGVVKPGEKVTKHLVVRGKMPFRVLGVECEPCDGQLQADLSQAKQAALVHVIPVTFIAAEKEGRIESSIRVQVDLSDAQDKALEITALAVVKP